MYLIFLPSVLFRLSGGFFFFIIISSSFFLVDSKSFLAFSLPRAAQEVKQDNNMTEEASMKRKRERYTKGFLKIIFIPPPPLPSAPTPSKSYDDWRSSWRKKIRLFWRNRSGVGRGEVRKDNPANAAVPKLRWHPPAVAQSCCANVLQHRPAVALPCKGSVLAPNFQVSNLPGGRVAEEEGLARSLQCHADHEERNGLKCRSVQLTQPSHHRHDKQWSSGKATQDIAARMVNKTLHDTQDKPRSIYIRHLLEKLDRRMRNELNVFWGHRDGRNITFRT